MSLSLGLGPCLSANALGGRCSIYCGRLPGRRGPSRGLRSDRRLAGSAGGTRKVEEVERTRGKCWISASGGGASDVNCLPPRGLSQGLKRSNGSGRGHRTICSATVLDYETLQWVSSISCLVLMLAKGTAIQKSFLAPLFTLQAPASVLSWIRGDYGISTAFVALLVRLFYYIPAELDLPFLTALLVIVTPYQAAGLRGTQIGAVISLVIAGYLAFQHFSRAGTFQKAFDQGSVVATLAVVFITAVPLLGLF